MLTRNKLKIYINLFTSEIKLNFIYEKSIRQKIIFVKSYVDTNNSLKNSIELFLMMNEICI